jgi:hypothetical protein
LKRIFVDVFCDNSQHNFDSQRSDQIPALIILVKSSQPKMNDDNPWGAASPAKELKDVSSNRFSYQEPSLSPAFLPAKPVDLAEESDPSPWESGSGTTYPPSAANPFNAPRTSALRTLETPKKNSQVRLAPNPAGESRAETPLSSPGLDGPLTYSWQPKAEIVLGLAVVDFNHLASPSMTPLLYVKTAG